MKIKHEKWLLPTILILLTFFLNVNTVSNTFDYDDYPVLVDNDKVKYWHFWDLWYVLGRGTRTLSLMLDYQIFGYSPAGYHIQNILWHLLAVVVLFILFKKITKNSSISFLGALFFAVHPVHVESVANISNRKDLLCLFFFASSFIFYLKFIEELGAKKWYFFFAGIFTFFLAINSKEVALTLPLIIVAYEFLFVARNNRFLGRRPLLILITAAIGAVLLLGYITTVFDLNQLDSITTLGGRSGELSLHSIWATAAPAFCKYIKLLLFPFALSPDHIIHLYQSFIDPFVLLPLLLVVGFIYASFFFVGKNNILAFSLFWLLINYMPVSNVIPLTYIVADRYMYIPSAGFCLFLAVIVHYLYKRVCFAHKGRLLKNTVIIIVGIIVLCFSIKTVRYNGLWRVPLNLWTYAIKMYPLSSKAYVNRGRVNHQSGKLESALKDYDYSISLNPSYFPGYYNRAILHKELGRLDQAISDYSKVIELRSGTDEAYTNRGNIYIGLGEYDKGISDYNMAIEIKEMDWNAYYNRCLAYYEIGNIERAIKDCNMTLQFNPRFAKGYYLLGLINKELDKSDEAAIYFDKAASLGLKK